MRILHLTPELPYEPGGGGGATREFFLCQRLAQLGHEVLNVSPVAAEDRASADALRAVGVRNWVAPRPASPLVETARATLADPSVLGAAVTRPVRALEMRVFWARIRELVLRAVDDFRPDVVIVGHDMALAWVDDLPYDLPAVLTCHNLTWRWYESRARHASPARAALFRAEAARYRRHVLSRLGRYDTAVAVSTLEAQELEDIGLSRVALIPTGVDTGLLVPAPEQDGPPRVVFTGTMNYLPNYEGIAWFAREVWPLVRERRPDAVLDVVGKGPPDDIVALGGSNGITVHGFVDSMAPYFAAAHVVVVPIRAGAGIRVKIIEAMSAGRAVVSTSLGCEGLAGLEPGRHLLVEDEPARFAQQTVRLLDDPETRRRIASDARELAVERYDWQSLGDQLEAVLAAAVDRGRCTSG